METEHESTPPVTDPETVASEAGDPGQPAQQQHDEKRLLDQIGELRRQSVNDNSALAVCLQGLAAGMMDLSCRYQQEISTLLDGGHSVLQEHLPLARAMHTLMGLSRQVDRYVGLIHRLKDNGRRRESARPRGPLDGTVAYQDFVTGIAPSEEMKL
jgi:hypothetical protein